MPRTEEYAKLLMEKSQAYSKQEFMGATLAKLRGAMSCHLAVERDGEIIRQVLNKNPNFQPKMAFKLGDVAAKGYLNITDVNIAYYIYIYIYI